MLTKNDFTQLPNYRAVYAHGDQVFCIPSWQCGNDPVHAIVSDPMPRDCDHIKVWTAQGEAEVDVSYCRPGNATVVVEWLNMLQHDGAMQAPCSLPFLIGEAYEVTVICELPREAQMVGA